MAMPTNYAHLTRDTVKNQRTGYRNQAFLAPASWFTTISEPDTTTATGGGLVTVSTDHVFAAGKGFLEVYVLPQSIEAPGESAGEAGALEMMWKPKFELPGDSADQQQLIERLMNDDLILLVKDANCPDGGVRMFGCDCTPLTISKTSFSSGTKGNGKKVWALEGETACRYFYEGAIVKAA